MATDLPDLLAEHGIRAKSLRAGHNEKTICPRCGGGRTREPSLSLRIDDDGAGATWQCHRGNCDGFSGGGRVTGERGSNPPPREPAAVVTPVEHPTEHQDKPDSMYAWFAARGILADTVETFGIYITTHWFPEDLGEQRALVFPYKFRGELVNRKYRPPQKNPQMQDKGALRSLFNIDAIEKPDVVVWVEGEPDVMAVHEAGYPQCVTLPDGSPNKLRDEDDPAREDDKRFFPLATHADLLAKVKRFILAGDMDEPGLILREELARRLGRHRCWTVTWPDGCKDAGDTLKRHGTAAVQGCIEAAQPYPIEGLQTIAPGSLLALRRAGPPSVMSTGNIATDAIMAIPGDGRLIFVTGIPEHGKSSWVRAVSVHLMEHHARKFLVFSPEETPAENYVARCASVWCGRPFWSDKDGDRMSDEDLTAAERWLTPRMTMLVNDSGSKPASVEWIIERAVASVLRDGTTDLLIDPWNQVEHGRGRMTETDYIGQSLLKLRAFNRRHGCNVWIVIHPTKPQGLQPGAIPPPPTLYDCAGGAHWKNAADLGITVYRSGNRTDVHRTKARFEWWRRGNHDVGSLDFERSTGRYFDMEGAGHDAVY